jgi:hypothetical protein
MQALLGAYKSKKRKDPPKPSEKEDSTGKRVKDVEEESAVVKEEAIDKFTFVHPTKNGGTAIEDFLSEHYSTYFTGHGHNHTCAHSDHNVIVIREPVSRFISMFKYWKLGGDHIYKRDSKFVEKYGDTTISDFLDMLRSGNITDLHQEFTWHLHFSPQSHWLQFEDYKKTIVIRYDKTSLQDKLFQVLEELKIPNIGASLPMVNVSLGKDEGDNEYTLTEKEKRQLKNLFPGDFDMWNKINKYPELFRMVV